MDRQTRIAVVGGGLAGLTVAALLQRDGYPVAVYEQTPNFSRNRAGIILGANVAKVLRSLDLEPSFTETAFGPMPSSVAPGTAARRSNELVFDAACEARFGGPFVNIHRADLHRILQTPLAPERSGSVIGWRDSRRRRRITLTFDNGATPRSTS